MDRPNGTKLAVETADGQQLEALLHLPEATPSAIVVATHPHPLYGGDMFNTAPATLAQALPQSGLGVLRFNFRGVGGSTGEHGEGIAEQADVVGAIDAALSDDRIGLPGYLVGYSFGADVALAVADDRIAGWAAIAPPLRLFDSFASAGDVRPKLVLSPAADQFCPTERAVETTEEWTSTTVRGIPGDHFLAAGIGEALERVLAFVGS